MIRLTAPAVLLLSLLLAACAPKNAQTRASASRAGVETSAFANIDLELERGLRTGAFPGAVLSIARDGEIIYERALGKRDPAEGDAMTTDTIFDVASLTKPVATSAGAALLMCEGRLADTDTVYGYPVGDLLSHMVPIAQYVAWEDLTAFRPDRSPAQAVAAWAGSTPQPVRSPGYSNLGYLLMAGAVEMQAGERLGEFVDERLWEPLRMDRTFFRLPPEAADWPIARSDREVPAGEPFDPLAAWVLREYPDADPGHSGLFSTARDLTIFCQAILSPERAAVPEMVCVADLLMTAPVSREGGAQFADALRTRGFQTGQLPKAGGTAYFHTGYTGAAIWMNPKTKVSVVFLTNASWSGSEAWLDVQREIIRLIERGTVREEGEQLYDPDFYRPPSQQEQPPLELGGAS